MTKEEKLEEAKRLYKTANADQRYVIESLFPELVENEDERIRRGVIKYLQCCVDDMAKSDCPFDFKTEIEKLSKYIAWLEKQGEQKETLCDKCKKEQPSHSCQDITSLGRCAIEKQNEKSSIRERYDRIKNSEWFKKTHEGMSVSDENIETKLKFNVGDWVVFNNKHQSIYQIEKIENGYYILRHTHGGSFRVCVLHDESLRLWSIADIKDGDVLAVNGKPFICHHTDEYKGNYCCIDNIGCFRTNIRFSFEGNCILPATKEQRNFLFQEIHKAGYKWDKEKKELKMIEKHAPKSKRR